MAKRYWWVTHHKQGGRDICERLLLDADTACQALCEARPIVGQQEIVIQMEKEQREA